MLVSARATGFIGKVLVEKILRCCPGVERLYLLMRPSKGQSVDYRLREFIQNEIFSKVKEQQPKGMEKVTAVTGDITMPQLGLSSSDFQLLIENVSVVFHSAATIRFNEELKTALVMNVKGPMELLEICRKMKHLVAFVHVSTAFNNLDREKIKEEVYYNPNVNPVKLIEYLDGLGDETLKNMTPELVGECPNTYVYTKGLAEQLLETKRGSVPLAIVRPSIVTAAESEPFPGWVDNMNGATGVIAGIGNGFIRVLKVKNNLVGDCIPVDYPINLLIAVAWFIATRRPSGVPVYSCTTVHRNPLTWGTLKHWVLQSWLKFPTKDMLWYPSVHYITNNLSLKINQTLFHYLPAYLMDLFMLATGKRAKWVRLYMKADKAISSLEFFTTHQWRFISDNPIHLLEEMTTKDREMFYFDVRNINWQSYLENYILGIRQFTLKDDPTTLPAARTNLKRLYMAQLCIPLLLSIVIVFVFKSLLLSFILYHGKTICFVTEIFSFHI
ncbi:putative fatty acyl-CoA reductase CG5065 isoform X2 [Daphnia pulicaria]|uniref:putative fatty acyl-CoA reductase CG5065 isoform X2 n=1 Tax=Daphnia pulicaria TaxID=35523 RepID=UPI001EEACB74|nr:putative fatty acyl-CoA reductase CG5065 isoform X2 [Daphnia pulicaria]